MGGFDETTAQLPLLQWLDCLHAQQPPAQVHLIGAGAGTGEWIEGLRRWNVPQATLVEADDTRCRLLQEEAGGRAGWRVLHQVVAGATGSVDFYETSLAAENGLFDPRWLRETLWPNLALKHVRARDAITLASLMFPVRPATDTDPRSGPRHWVFIDCLPALPLLQAAERTLGAVDVVLARVILDDSSAAAAGGCGDGSRQAAHLAPLTNWLQARDLRLLMTRAGRHPGIGHALFARDPQPRFVALLRQIDEQSTGQRRLEEELAAGRRLLVEQVASANRLQAMLDAAIAERDDARQSCASHRAMHEQLATELQRVEAERQSLSADLAKTAQACQAAQLRVNELAAAAEKPQKAAPAAPKVTGDADIDGLIADIAPFFTERSITYVDVGAYVGDVFLKLQQAKGLRMREAHLYEPNPSSFATLTERMRGSRLPTLHAYQLAVGASAGSRRMSAAQSMSRITDDTGDAQAITNTFETEAVTLDQQARRFTDGRINLLKIDVEGRELDVLEGAQALLREQAIDMIYIEVGFNRRGTQQTYFGDIDEFLQERGYRVFRIYEQMNEWIQDSPLMRRCNFAYMSERFAQTNPLKLSLKLQSLQAELRQLKSKSERPLAQPDVGAMP